MTTDALDPGPDNSFPFWPRLADGITDPARMPRGARAMRGPDGTGVVYDPAPGNPDGTPAGPPEPPPVVTTQ